jgi:hypothetical protein
MLKRLEFGDTVGGEGEDAASISSGQALATAGGTPALL